MTTSPPFGSQYHDAMNQMAQAQNGLVLFGALGNTRTLAPAKEINDDQILLLIEEGE